MFSHLFGSNKFLPQAHPTQPAFRTSYDVPQITLSFDIAFSLGDRIFYRGVWFVFLNNNFQFLNNITWISKFFFTHTYFYKYFQITNFSFYTHISNEPIMFHIYSLNFTSLSPSPSTIYLFLAPFHQKKKEKY